MSSEDKRIQTEFTNWRKKYPTLASQQSTCIQIDQQIAGLKTDLQSVTNALGNGNCGNGCKRVNNRAIGVINYLISEKQSQRDGLRCTEYLENKKLKESAEVLEDASIDAEDRIGGQSNVHRFTMLIVGATVLIAAIIIIKNR